MAQTKGNGCQRFSALEKGRSPAPHAPLLLTVGVYSPVCSLLKMRRQAKSGEPRIAG